MTGSARLPELGNAATSANALRVARGCRRAPPRTRAAAANNRETATDAPAIRSEASAGTSVFSSELKMSAGVSR